MRGLGSGLLAATAMLSAAPAVEAQVATDQVHITCGLHYGDQKRPTQFTPIVKATMPSLPVGSSIPNTVPILDRAFSDMMLERGVRFSKAFCIGGESVDQVRRRVADWEARSGYGVMAKEELAFDTVWPPMFDRISPSHRSLHRGITREMYAAEVVGSVADRIGKAAP